MRMSSARLRTVKLKPPSFVPRVCLIAAKQSCNDAARMSRLTIEEAKGSIRAVGAFRGHESLHHSHTRALGPKSRRWSRRGVMGSVLLSALLGLTGCNPGSSLDRHSVPTHPSGGGSHLGALQGQLGGQVNKDGTACLWVQNGAKTILVWPDGYFATGNPLGIANAQGDVLATIGKQVTLGGGLAPDDFSTQSLVGCNFGSNPRIFLVGEVVPPGS